jgi:hypothetical protein
VIPIALLALRDFLAVHGNVAGRLDADANLRSIYRHDGHFDVIADAQTLPGSASQYQHGWAPPEFSAH